MVDMANKFNPQPKKGMPEKKKPRPLKRTAIKKKKVKPGKELLPVFIDIWTTRQSGKKFVPREYNSMEEWLDHVWKYRVCAVTYEPIQSFLIHNYAHVLARQFTLLRESKINIGMLHFDVHASYDTETREKFLAKGPGAKWWLEYHDYLKSNYNQGEYE